MGFQIPTGVMATCDQDGCKTKVEIPLKHIKSGITKANLIRKIRRLGWYASKKNDIVICPDCRERMGLPNTSKNKGKVE